MKYELDGADDATNQDKRFQQSLTLGHILSWDGTMQDKSNRPNSRILPVVSC